MAWENEYDAFYDMAYDPQRYSTTPGKNAEGGLDPMDIVNPVSVYFFLSDDALDEITGTDKKKMKCLSCGPMFKDEIYDRCPECFSSDTEEEADEKDHGYW